MAGIGPAPAEKRRRANAPARGEWVDLEPLKEAVLPEIDGVSPRVLAVWESWRADPVTAHWTSADVDYALDTIDLRERSWPQKADEIRRRMDSLGLTPKGKRDLRWRVADVPEGAVARKPRRVDSERRARLSVVK